MARFTDLPWEILDQFAKLIATSDSIKSLVLTSRFCHHNFDHLLWRHITIGLKSPPTLTNTLLHYAHLFHSLEFIGGVPEEVSQIHFPNLVVFKYNNARQYMKTRQVCYNAADLFRSNPTIQDVIVISPGDLHFRNGFWEAIATLLHRPRRLQVGNRDVQMRRMKVEAERAFWRACGRFEQVEIVGWDQSRGFWDSGIYDCSRLRKFDYTVRDHPADCAKMWRWLTRCRNLTRLRWDGLIVAEEVAAMIEAKTNSNSSSHTSPGCWPHLEDVYLGSIVRASDEHLFVLIDHLPPSLKHFGMSYGRFGTTSFGLFRDRQFDSLRTLSLQGFGSLQSEMSLQVLLGCVHLEVLRVHRLFLRDVHSDPRPWACRSLRILQATFLCDPEDLAGSTALLFDQLSRLTCLEELDISRYSNPGNFSEWVRVIEVSPQLRLDRGLNRLLTLTRLRRVKFVSAEQDLRREDVEWMLGSWPVLDSLIGRMSGGKSAHEQLAELVRERGVVAELK